MAVDWRAHLKPEEIERLAAMKAQDASNVKERRRIYFRCRKRAEKALKENA